MNGNGQVVVAGLFLAGSMAVAMFAVGLFEFPTYAPEAKPLELLPIDADNALFSPAPIEMLQVNIDEALFGPASIELIRQHTGSSDQGLSPEQIYHGATMQAQAETAAVIQASSFAHTGTCSGRY